MKNKQINRLQLDHYKLTGVKKPVLFHLLTSIPVKEIKKWEDFLVSPFFNVKEWQIELWQILKPFYPHFDKIEKKEIWNQSSYFREKPFQAQRLHEYFAEMSLQVRHFLKQLTISSQADLERKIEYATAQQFDYPAWYANTAFKEAPLYSKKWFLEVSDCANIVQVYHQILPDARINGYFEYSNFATMYEDALDNYFMINKLKSALPDISRAIRAGKEAEIPWLKEIRAHLDAMTKNHHPLLRIYYELVTLYFEWDSDRFRRAIDLYIFISQQLSKTEQFYIIMQFTNLIAKQPSVQLHEFQFLLFKDGVKNGIYQHTSRLRPRTFLNICNSGAIAKQKEWTEKFIQDHVRFLAPDSREAYQILGLARIAFHQQQYDKAISLLRTAQPKDKLIALNVRSMTVRCLLYSYLNGYIPHSVLTAEITAFTRYIERKKTLGKSRKRTYLNMLQAVQQIAELRHNDWTKPEEKNRLYAQIKNKNPLIGKEWVLQTLEMK